VPSAIRSAKAAGEDEEYALLAPPGRERDVPPLEIR
jgi:hypothetical protein